MGNIPLKTTKSRETGPKSVRAQIIQLGGKPLGGQWVVVNEDDNADFLKTCWDGTGVAYRLPNGKYAVNTDVCGSPPNPEETREERSAKEKLMASRQERALYDAAMDNAVTIAWDHEKWDVKHGGWPVVEVTKREAERHAEDGNIVLPAYECRNGKKVNERKTKWYLVLLDPETLHHEPDMAEGKTIKIMPFLEHKNGKLTREAKLMANAIRGILMTEKFWTNVVPNLTEVERAELPYGLRIKFYKKLARRRKEARMNENRSKYYRILMAIILAQKYLDTHQGVNIGTEKDAPEKGKTYVQMLEALKKNVFDQNMGDAEILVRGITREFKEESEEESKREKLEGDVLAAETTIGQVLQVVLKKACVELTGRVHTYQSRSMNMKTLRFTGFTDMVVNKPPTKWKKSENQPGMFMLLPYETKLREQLGKPLQEFFDEQRFKDIEESLQNILRRNKEFADSVQAHFKDTVEEGATAEDLRKAIMRETQECMQVMMKHPRIKNNEDLLTYIRANPDDEEMKGMDKKCMVVDGKAGPRSIINYGVTRETTDPSAPMKFETSGKELKSVLQKLHEARKKYQKVPVDKRKETFQLKKEE